MLVFVLLAALLATVALALTCWPALARDRAAAHDGDLQRASEIAIHKERIRGIEAAVEAGDLDGDAAAVARAEAERALLESLDGLDTGATEAPRSSRWLSAGVAALLIVGMTVGGYARFGTPEAITPPPPLAELGPEQADAELRRSTEALALRLTTDVDDGQGWTLLARSRVALGDFDGAIGAFGRARELLGDNDAQRLADHAEALAMRARDVAASGALPLVARALALEPQQPKALWLDGLGALQSGDPVRARARLTPLLARMKPGSPEHATLSRLLGDLDGAAPAAAPAQPPLAGPSIDVTVSVGPALVDAAARSGATLFVFARDASIPEGQPAPPLAVVRIAEPTLPLNVTLDASSAMVPGRTLASAERVMVVARLSYSGEPRGASGDVEGRSAEFRPETTPALGVVLDRRIP